jgi:molecular chaperone IbpA
MEFVVNKREFVRALSRVQSVADKKSAMPILTNVLIVADASGVRLAATDLTLAVTAHCKADVRKGGTVALPARHVFDVVKVLPDGDVTVTVEKNFSARIKSGKRRFDLSGMPGEDFPTLPDPSKVTLTLIPADDVAEDNDSADSASSSLVRGVPIDGAACGNDADFYRLPVQAGCMADVQARFVHARGDIDLQLVSIADPQTVLASSASTNNVERIVRVVDPGAVVARAFLFNGADVNAGNAYRITVAVAGFGEADLAIEIKENALLIRGSKDTGSGAEPKAEILYQGIAARAFERRFQLAEHVEVTGASLRNGLLHVELVRQIPEAQKPRRIPIGGAKVVEASRQAA